jgi:hypothetical protein
VKVLLTASLVDGTANVNPRVIRTVKGTFIFGDDEAPAEMRKGNETQQGRNSGKRKQQSVKSITISSS